MKKGFVHLHVHTEYSLLDGLPKINDLLEAVKKFDMPAVAITDHGALYGAIEFYKKAKEMEIKPIIGMEAYVVNYDHQKKPESKEYQTYHLLLLAKNEVGYRNLIEISTRAHLEGYYYRPRIYKELLKNYKEGLIVSSACAQGEIAQNLIAGDYDKAKKVASWFLEIFGDDYYLEIQRHKFGQFVSSKNNPEINRMLEEMADNEEKINKGVIQISQELGIPIIATNDVHYLYPKDAKAQDALLCIGTGKKIEDIKRLRFIDSPTFYLLSVEEAYNLFFDLKEAVENTLNVAKKCEWIISTIGKWYFPKVDLPAGKTADEHLKELVYKDLPKKYITITPEVKERVEYELEVITKKGYSPYFLIYKDIVDWTKRRGIITNTRGSAAGSIVSYILGITTVDPLKYYLPFERFLNLWRPSPPDIDLDVSDDKRDLVIDYITKKYGKEKVAQICTFGRMLSRAAVRDVARVLGFPYSTGDRIAKLIPFPRQGFPVSIDSALKESSELLNLYKKDKDAKTILDLARQIEGNARHVSVHAAGLVIAPDKLTNFTPLQKEPSGDKIITQYEMHACEDVGLIKLDILGIRNLSILGYAIELVEKLRGKKIDLYKIPLDDKKTFEMLGRGETMGVFQLSSAGMTKYLKELKPTKVEDLMAMVALYRPGPMQVIPEFIKRKKDPSKIVYLDPRMEKYLSASYGLIVYQDDLLFSAIELAGYTWEEADKFRKAVGKKIPKEMRAQKERFVKGVIENGQTKEFAEKLWKLFEPFQSYGFNKAHAASYGMVAYWTAYMKANYPVEYMTALLTAESQDITKISQAVNECRRMGIKVLSPDINESDDGFKIVEYKNSLEGKAIRFGLNAIKNVGKAAIDEILRERAKGKFRSLTDFLSRTDARKINKKVIESLIKVGAFSSFGTRAALLSRLEDLKDKLQRKVVSKNEDQQALFGSEELKEDLVGPFKEEMEMEEFSEEEIQTLERELLGFSLSAKPISEIIGGISLKEEVNKIAEIIPEQLEEINHFDTKFKIVGVVREIQVIITRKTGQEMAFVKMEDETGVIEVVIFPKIYFSTKDLWKENQVVVIEGRISLSAKNEIVLVADSVFDLHSFNAVKKEDSVKIKIPRGTTKETLQKLKNLLLHFPGEKDLILVFEEKNNVEFNTGIKISYNEKLAKLINILLEGKDFVARN